jgi:hypothetical protein
MFCSSNLSLGCAAAYGTSIGPLENVLGSGKRGNEKELRASALCYRGSRAAAGKIEVHSDRATGAANWAARQVCGKLVASVAVRPEPLWLRLG